MHKFIPQIEEKRQAIFVGFFGPIGVSAIFYLYISLEFLETITVDGVQREDAEHLGEVISVVVWFLTICSIVVHGLSIPLGKLGFFLPRTLSRAFTSQANSQTDLAIGARVYTSNSGVLRERRRGNASADASGSGTAQGSLGSAITTPALSSGTSPRPIYRIGGSVIRSGTGKGVTESGSGLDGEEASPAGFMDGAVEGRTIRFPDEEAHVASGMGRERDSEV